MFTFEELKTGMIPNEYRNYVTQRVPLDSARIKLMKGSKITLKCVYLLKVFLFTSLFQDAIKTKFSLGPMDFEEIWNTLRVRINTYIRSYTYTRK